MLLRSLLLTSTAFAVLAAADGTVPQPSNVPPATSGNGASMQIARLPPRWYQAKEVELVLLDSATDKAGLARWAELASVGYGLSQVYEMGGKSYLFLERNRNNAQDEFALPAAVEADPAVANPLRAKIMTQVQQQQQAMLQFQHQQRPMGRPANPAGDSSPSGAPTPPMPPQGGKF